MMNYSNKGHYYIEEPRFELNHLMPLLPKSAHILDIGAGNGNNTRFLLEKGYIVTAVEPNPDAIKILRQLQESYPESLTVIEASVDAYAPAETFDVVICCMVVHFMEGKAVGLQAIRNIQSWTKRDGINLLTGYMSNQALPKDYSFLFNPGELAHLYGGWQVHWAEESYRLSFSRIYSFMDIPRLLLGKRGFKAARMIAQKS